MEDRRERGSIRLIFVTEIAIDRQSPTTLDDEHASAMRSCAHAFISCFPKKASRFVPSQQSSAPLQLPGLQAKAWCRHRDGRGCVAVCTLLCKAHSGRSTARRSARDAYLRIRSQLKDRASRVDQYMAPAKAGAAEGNNKSTDCCPAVGLYEVHVI